MTLLMDRIYLLAAEMFNYSYDKYADSVEFGKERFTKMMPKDARVTEEAELNRWSDDKLAEELDCSKDEAIALRDSYRSAVEIIDQDNLASLFRKGVTASIQYAIQQGLKNEDEINQLAEQICYRAADLSYLLTTEGKELRDISENLRS